MQPSDHALFFWMMEKLISPLLITRVVSTVEDMFGTSCDHTVYAENNKEHLKRPAVEAVMMMVGGWEPS